MSAGRVAVCTLIRDMLAAPPPVPRPLAPARPVYNFPKDAHGYPIDPVKQSFVSHVRARVSFRHIPMLPINDGRIHRRLFRKAEQGLFFRALTSDAHEPSLHVADGKVHRRIFGKSRPSALYNLIIPPSNAKLRAKQTRRARACLAAAIQIPTPAAMPPRLFLTRTA